MPIKYKSKTETILDIAYLTLIDNHLLTIQECKIKKAKLPIPDAENKIVL